MPIPVSCQCGQRLSAQDSLAGKRVLCPSCKNPLSIPAVEAPVELEPLGGGSGFDDLASMESDPLGGGLGLDGLAGMESDAFSPLGGATPSMMGTPMSSLGQPQGAPAANYQSEDRIGKPVIFALIGGGVFLLGLLFVGIIMSFLDDSDSEVAAKPETSSQNLPRSTPPPAPATPPVQPPTPTPTPTEDPEPDDSSSSSSSNNPSTPSKPKPAPLPKFEIGLEKWYTQENVVLSGTRQSKSKDQELAMQQYSWMCDLLPHLGHQKLYDQFKFDQSWMRDPNLSRARTVVPQFLNPLDDRKTWKGYPYQGLALTHFVGMSGIEDQRNVVAAKLPRSDPRAGIFGYSEMARRQDITDGTGQTILMIGSGGLASPWVQGGGATIRGARKPYFDSLSGFGSRGGKKRGTMVVMADGSVHYLSADIDPAVFKAMCTIHGRDSVDSSQVNRVLGPLPMEFRSDNKTPKENP